MKNFEITIHNKTGKVIFSEVARALNGTNALLKMISEFNLIIKNGDKVVINEL